MALIGSEFCVPCGKTTQHVNQKCVDCLDLAQRVEIATWAAKTTDQKLMDIHLRPQRLEAGPPRCG